MYFGLECYVQRNLFYNNKIRERLASLSKGIYIQMERNIFLRLSKIII